jgi:alpha-2-macroglobulin
MRIASFALPTPAFLLRFALALLCVAPVTCQSEAQPYFALSSERTFGSEDTPIVSLSGWQVNAVQIRVYRVNNVEEFFRRAEGSHSFGGAAPRPAGKRTVLENLRSWKRGLRRNIRLFLRGQFTESVSAHFHREETPKSLPSNPEAYFAEAPLLNKDQLVLSFLQALPNKNNWSSATVPIRVRDKGIYLVEAVNGKLRAYTIVIKSDLVAITKSGKSRLLGYVVDRQSGEPVADAEITAMTRNGTPQAVKTNAQGIAEIPGPKATASAGDDFRLVVRKRSDVTLAAISLWNFGDAATAWMGYIYTDRPVYRPADTIHFRGILRIPKTPVGYAIPADETVAVQITDPDGKSVYEKRVTANQNGIIHDEFTIDRSAALGNYYVQVSRGQGAMTGNFEVQEYKKPEYEVHVTPEKSRVLEGEKVAATIDARYYFGEPVAGAKVEYSIYRSRYWYPLWRDSEEELETDESGYESEFAAGEEVLKSEGQLDTDGKLRIQFDSTVSDEGIDYRYRIEARVTDEARREISGTGWMIATYGNFMVNVEPQEYIFEPSGSAELKISAFDYEGRPVATSISLALKRWTFVNRTASQPVLRTVEASTGSDGAGTARVPLPAQGGSYEVEASAVTASGRRVRHGTFLWVAASGPDSIWAGASKSVQIVPDKKSYRPGDKARILIVTGQPHASILVSIEGRDVRKYSVLRSPGSTAMFEYMVSKDDEPGFFMTAQLVRNGQMYRGQKRIKVVPDDHCLNVDMVTDKPQYQPGETAGYELKVTGADGKPVSNADFSLGVVDEAIYAIRPDPAPDLLKFFYGSDWNAVNTEDSLNYFFNGEAGTRRMLLAVSPARQARLAQLKQQQLVLPKIRKIFPDTAFWAADLTTDANGRARTRVTFPDSLTTWRATARGATATNQFGGATLKTVVRKNVMVRLALPRFFVQGDETVISAIVHNYLPSAKQARVSVSLQGLEVLNGSTTQEVELPSHGEVRVDWRVKTRQVTEAKINGQALTNQESDAVEMTLPVHPQGISVRQAKGGTLSNGGTAAFTVTFPADAEPGSRSVSIRLSSSLAGSIFNALDFLTSFPYGCVEQTMSSFLPNLMVGNSVRLPGVAEPIDRKQLDAQVKAGLERLYSMQHEDGGWGWWASDDSQAFMTAYVVVGLAEAKAVDISVNQNALDRGIAWLKKNIGKGTAAQPDLRAYVVYALGVSGNIESTELNSLFSERSTLSPYAAALLGLALENAKDRRAATVAGEVERNAKQNADEAWWPASRDEMLDFEADITPEATSYAMKFLTHEHKDSPLLPKAALWLVNHRNQGYWWTSSKQTAMVIYGLIDYLKNTNELNPKFTANITVNGQPVSTQSFQASSPSQAPEIFLPEEKLQRGANEVKISMEGEGRLYYAVSGTHYSNQAKLERQGAVSLNILRDYFRLTSTKESGQIVYDLSALNGPVSSGDVVAVRLTVTGSDWRYLLAEDPIPAGTEFIEKDHLFAIRNRPPWWRYAFTRRELHDDRMAIFQTYFSQGQQQYFYLLKVVNPGLFHASPASVQPMYQSGIQATTEARTLEVNQ